MLAVIVSLLAIFYVYFCCNFETFLEIVCVVVVVFLII